MIPRLEAIADERMASGSTSTPLRHRRPKRPFAVAGLHPDDGPRAFLGKRDVALLGQFEARNEGAGPAGAPSQWAPGVAAIGRLIWQELLERSATRHSGKTPQDPITGLGDLIGREWPGPVDLGRV